MPPISFPVDLSALTSVSPTSAPRAAGGLPSMEGSPVAGSFGEVLTEFLGQVDTSQHRANELTESLALGEPVDVHQVMLALNEASNALHLTAQVRTKALEAYQELMRIQL